ncbi:hypothetical protein [Pseudomonas sp. NFR16]|uniref:hypothetical protein n=1 Tax=Pseudomonas sp. NFR16 TaxID=1566248 RepID=UPI0008D16B06|nr:hypothetical protein [Pseudomonas sp. NFR16]SEJ95610.1 hypothetical protein SAMN03159495_5500 [Pseudomonas sp. NFR16]
MSASDTEERIIAIICDHFLSGGKEKLTVSSVSERAGISRQAFHKSYLHLKPFVTGQRTVDDLLLRQGSNPFKVILQMQNLVRNLQSELEEVRSGQSAKFEDFERNIVTSLMSSDILTHRAKELTAELRKKALHVELLKRELTEKEVELTLATAGSQSSAPPALAKNIMVQVFKPDMTAALADFSSSKDKQAYLAHKEKAIAAMQLRVLKVLRQGTIRVVIFQERFLCSLDTFVERNFSKNSASVVVINLPLYSRLEIRDFTRALKGATPLEIYVPHCDSDAVINAQRGFQFGQIPDFEFKAVGREPLPTIQDGYDKVTVFRVEQGD